MTLRVAQTAEAEQDVEEIVAYLSAESPALAFRFYDAIENSYEQLAKSPHLGGRLERQDFRFADIRVWRVKGFPNHLIFYQPLEDCLVVVRVRHGATNYAEIFR